MARSLLRYSLSNAQQENGSEKPPVTYHEARITGPPQIEKVAKVTAGTAAALFMVLRLKRELYGPGGSKMSRYHPDVDKLWKRDRD